MDPKSENPLRLFVNPFAIWTDLAFKTGQAMWASAYVAAVRSTRASKVAVIPTADAPASNDAQEPQNPARRMLASAHAAALRNTKVAVLPSADAPRSARPPARKVSKAARFKTTRAKLRSKAAKATRRAKKR